MTGGRASRRVGCWVALLLGLHFAMAVGSKVHQSTTSDELVHLTGGFTYWRFDDYRLQPENGNLPQRWVALPAVVAGVPFPYLDQVYWKVSDAWVMGHEFFYETGHDHFPMLMAARAMTAVFSVALGLLVFLWSRRLFGTAGAFVSLLFFTFCPTVLAHGGYATSDVCMAFFMLASVGAYWRHLGRPGAGPLALSAVTFGLACVAKFSAPLLLPMLAVCAVVHLAAARGSCGRVLGSAAVHALAALAIIWACYGFRYSAFNPAVPAADQFIEDWPQMYARTGGIGVVIHHLADWKVLPEAFLYGMAYVVQTSQARGAFLNGEYSLTGWPSFFPWAFGLKTTLPFLLAAAAATVLLVRRKAATPPVLALTPLLALFVIYWAVSITSHLNIGVRHLLPTYPVLFILTGVLGTYLVRPRRGGALLVALLLAWHAGESLAVAPHYISYFNEVAGGPAGGYRHLVDSSIDWGQDLPGLADWLKGHRRPHEDVYLAYFGTGEPTYYGIDAKHLNNLNAFLFDEPYIDLGPGLYCVSVTSLMQPYGITRGAWTRENEREFEVQRVFEPRYREFDRDPAKRAQLVRDLPESQWVKSRNRYQQLRFARLCHYLRVRHPDAVVNYSIFVYRLSAEEVRAATGGSLQEWSQLIERAAGAAPTP